MAPHECAQCAPSEEVFQPPTAKITGPMDEGRVALVETRIKYGNLVVKDDIEEGAVHAQCAIVINEA